MPEWAAYIVSAWFQLTNDRAHYDTGACSGIWYASISDYAKDHSLSGDEFSDFLLFFRAIDNVYVEVTGEAAKKAMDAIKQKSES